MARIRTIKPEFFTSLTNSELPIPTRLTFIGLWTHSDDEGRCVDDARLIKAAIWPLERSVAQVEADLKRLAVAEKVTRYTIEGRRFLAITEWHTHQRINRPTPSKYPGPEWDDSHRRDAQ